MVPETRYARSGDLNIAYQVTGDGPFDLVFVPGYVTHLELHWEIPSFVPVLERLGSFTQSYGSQELDASLLLLPLVGFLPGSDPRVRGTVEAIERELVVDDLVLRYNSATAKDGLPPGEGVFLACSFWLADNYILQGRRADAVRMFERLAGLANDVGLLAEQYDPVERRLIGNFPQAFSHLALVNTASNLANYRKPAEQRTERKVGSPAMPAAASLD